MDRDQIVLKVGLTRGEIGRRSRLKAALRNKETAWRICTVEQFATRGTFVSSVLDSLVEFYFHSVDV